MPADSDKRKAGFNYLFNNLYASTLFLFLLYILFSALYGQRTLDNYVIKNLTYIWNHPSLSTEEKWEIKHGYDYTYLRFIKRATPENAVIWMPADSSITSANGSNPFRTGIIGIRTEAWATYFLYPRKPVYDTSRVDAVDYVAIVNEEGYERLPYEVDHQPDHTVLPMTKTSKPN